MSTYAQDIRNNYRLTAMQREVLDQAYAEEAITPSRTATSLRKRGMLNADGSLTPLGRDVLMAYC